VLDLNVLLFLKSFLPVVSSREMKLVDIHHIISLPFRMRFYMQQDEIPLVYE